MKATQAGAARAGAARAEAARAEAASRNDWRRKESEGGLKRRRVGQQVNNTMKSALFSTTSFSGRWYKKRTHCDYDQ